MARNTDGLLKGKYLPMLKCGHRRPIASFDICQTCLDRSVMIPTAGKMVPIYTPQDHQVPFHESQALNLLALGTRGTGKSVSLRWDAILRCLLWPGFRALLLRRTLQDLRKNHLHAIAREMKLLGGTFNWTTYEARFPNGSILQLSHCESLGDVENYLGSEWGFIGFDELSTFTLEMFLKISVAARAPKDQPYIAVVRGGTNPLGIGAPWIKEWFVDKTVNLADYPDYNPDDFEMQFQTLEQNAYLDKADYEKRLKNLPEHIRKAWLLGEFVIEGAYFTDFNQRKQLEDGSIVPWHVIDMLPDWKGQPLITQPWLTIYRAVDWGYDPDPAVCLWIAVLPGGRAIVFKERTYRREIASEVAKKIAKESAGMRIADTFCDPSMFIKDGTGAYTIGDIFGQHGVPCTPAQNNREVYGTSVHDYLNTVVQVADDIKVPKVQILRGACPELLRTFPVLQMDETLPSRIADGPDHWVIALAYFCMGQASATQDPEKPRVRRWMQPKTSPRLLRYA